MIRSQSSLTSRRPSFASIVRTVAASTSSEVEMRSSRDRKHSLVELIDLRHPLSIDDGTARTVAVSTLNAKWMVFVDGAHPTSPRWVEALLNDLYQLDNTPQVAVSVGAGREMSASGVLPTPHVDVAYRSFVTRAYAFGDGRDGRGLDFDMQLQIVADGWTITQGERMR